MKGHALTVMDSGLLGAREQLALDLGQVQACRQRPEAALLRFHRYLPAVSLGAHEARSHAARLDYCLAHGVEVVRRLTGGGAVYRDPQQACWTLSVHVGDTLGGQRIGVWMRHLNRAVAAALRQLGVHARQAPPNDVEVEGRKLASSGLAVIDGVLVFQGGVLLDADAGTMLKVLRVPTEKLSARGIRSARDRLVALRDCTGVLPPVEAVYRALAQSFATALRRSFECRSPGGLVAGTPVEAAGALDENWQTTTGSESQSFLRTPGGVLRARLRLDQTDARIEQMTLAGAVHVHPVDAFRALEGHIRGVPLRAWRDEVEAFFQDHPFQALGFTCAAVEEVIELAAARVEQRHGLALTLEEANTLMVHEAAQGGHPQGAAAILGAAQVLLVPYCAKPPDCAWRNRDGCPECGRCTVGDAYRLARERGMRVISINNFEHLRETLAELRVGGIQAYVGMCCENFYLKRQHAFREAELPAVLMDISGSNCYELQQEDQAYAGRFQAQSELNMPVLEKVMRFVPAAGGGSRGKSRGSGHPPKQDCPR